MERCDRPACGVGTIDEHGFCGACALRPLRRSGPRTSIPSPGPRTSTSAPEPLLPPGPAGRGTAAVTVPEAAGQPPGGVAVATAAAEAGQLPGGDPAVGAPEEAGQVPTAPWWGLDLVDAEYARPAPDAPGADRTDRDETPGTEEHGPCPNPTCGATGRGDEGLGGRHRDLDREQDPCTVCRAPSDPASGPHGRTLADRYVVKRMLGAGAFGKAYLCHDHNLNTDVVLKVLHESVARTAREERNALVGLRHDSIVRILSYEPQGPYLVLEHIPGTRFAARHGDSLEVLLAHGLRILQALDYLHARQLLHCDVKPSNIIRFTEKGDTAAHDRVRLIDFGAVRSMKDTHPLVAFTATYAPPERHPGTGELDPEHDRPTAGLDLYCLGSTLQEVCRSQLRAGPQDIPVDSLIRLLRRATRVDAPERRFTSARQFAEQLSGVIRQVVAAAPRSRRCARDSVQFGSMTEPLHGGLGAARPLRHWVDARVTPDGACRLGAPFSPPTRMEMMAALRPPPPDPYDRRERRTGDRARRALDACHDALRRGEATEAEQLLSDAALPEWDWPHHWYAGLVALAHDRPRAGADHFGHVRDLLPGELVPLLALGLCAERDDRLAAARTYYETVVDTAPGLGAASFGLARVLLREGHRAEAVATAERLAREFRFEQWARIAAVRLRVALTTTEAQAELDPGDVESADRALEELVIGHTERLGVRAEIAFARYAVSGRSQGLSEAVRDLAPHAEDRHDHRVLVDLANRLRPPIRWPWSRLAPRRRRTT
ncbi:tetratricopeptide repeat protein [Streptomyces caniscabiei]|uniref:non-specific serine/threonine protein kinase n=1 Tax=Streptomyces caniscabiei TaxID=2746961 RepID=A0ABU4MGJ4_9ACTN|nr:tetratricopeptide repeat protein [Streptomyces caniscabiei]MBE4736194.1 protein kinase [Streptomyces caniscabiei]MBE4755678.1 protein kinase [Streptomyces caniscabiei]MBE4774224.1 protein kinase [Streptomyces caniscabiei]MBE4785839.1 protein kinase [Streptomyces caniscabiei]MBE4793860.1 protein kinase [Streptomyces caniscabiei]